VETQVVDGRIILRWIFGKWDLANFYDNMPVRYMYPNL
jgi:hypothetical protein